MLSRVTPRRILINVAAIFGGEALARLATFVMAVVIARRFGSVALGEYGYALALASILLLVPDFGLHLFTVRELSASSERLQPIFWNVHRMKLILGGAVVLFTLFFGSWGVPDSGRRILFYILAARVIFQTFSQASMAVFKAYERMHFIAVQQFVNAVLVVLWAGAALALHASMPVVVMGLIAGQAVETLLGWQFIRRHFSPGIPSPWDARIARTMVVACLPIGLTAMFQAVILRIDVLVLGHFASNRTLGQFQAAAWFPVGTFLAASLLMSVVFPKLSRLSRGEASQGSAYVKSLVKNGVLVTGAVALLVWATAPTLLAWLFGKDLTPAAGILRLLAPILPLTFLNTVLFYVLVATRRQAVYLGILGAGAVAGAALSFYLTSAYGPAGCAIADGAREFLISAAYLLCLVRDESAQKVGTAFLKVFGGATLVTAAGLRLGAPLHHSEPWFAVWMILVLAGTVCLLGFPSRGEWRLLTDDSL